MAELVEEKKKVLTIQLAASGAFQTMDIATLTPHLAQLILSSNAVVLCDHWLFSSSHVDVHASNDSVLAVRDPLECLVLDSIEFKLERSKVFMGGITVGRLHAIVNASRLEHVTVSNEIQLQALNAGIVAHCAIREECTKDCSIQGTGTIYLNGKVFQHLPSEDKTVPPEPLHSPVPSMDTPGSFLFRSIVVRRGSSPPHRRRSRSPPSSIALRRYGRSRSPPSPALGRSLIDFLLADVDQRIYIGMERIRELTSGDGEGKSSDQPLLEVENVPKVKEDTNGTSEADQCVACKERAKRVMNDACKHVTVCIKCVESLREPGTKCPVCRKHVTKWQVVAF